MQAALIATLARPEWWAMALAAFLVRGGILLVILPIVTVPTVAGLVADLSPIVEPIVLGKPSLEGALVGSALVALALVALAAAALAGSWLDLALVREATRDEDVDRGWRPARLSISRALTIRLTAHVPTLLAAAYGVVRVIDVAYAEFTAPSEAGVAIADRVIVRVPDVVAIVLVTWLAGETVGPLAVRRASTGLRASRALLLSVRQVVRPRGLATLVLTSAVLVGIALPFLLAAGGAWTHVRSYLLGGAGLGGADAVQLGAAIVLLVATWILGLAILGAGLAWRATAWTSEVTTG
jgi:hypothetical protein